jgi:hypothetical protein
MKFKQLFLLAALAALTATFNACKDGGGDENEDVNAPVLTIEEPAEGESISGEVHIHLQATDKSLHEMTVKVTQDSDGTVVFEDEPTVHDETDYHYDKSFTPSGLTGDTPMTLTVTVEDHSGNVTTKTVKFKVKP